MYDPWLGMKVAHTVSNTSNAFLTPANPWALVTLDGFLSSSCFGNGISFVIGRFSVASLLVLIVATLTIPSGPGWISIILAKGHLLGDVLSSFCRTKSPTPMFSVGVFHFIRCCIPERYSLDQIFQKSFFILCISFHRDNLSRLSSELLGSFGVIISLPIKKCPGVSAARSFGSDVNGQSGLEFKHASIWYNNVDNSSNVKVVSPTILFK